MTTSVALFDCPHCIAEFTFDYQKIVKLTYGWRVRVRCPGCGNIVEVVMLAYTVIHGCDRNKYRPGEIVEIVPPDPKASPDWRMAVNQLRMRFSKRRLGGDLSHAAEVGANQEGSGESWATRLFPFLETRNGVPLPTSFLRQQCMSEI